ncbi:hypothetical protein BKA62DRAFT_685212 [Auriculariales sp. MPI-PUGE-AT-0066]|nr:hypothetical protein BKA62DRAFT_685212 [Auriculariales sp. MPI-PUGE-AT-0066]
MRLLSAQVVCFAFIPFALAGLVPLSVANSAVTLQPAPTNDAQSLWAVFNAPGSFNGSAAFYKGFDINGGITIRSPVAFVALEFWAYQRSDGGILQITFDGAQASRIDIYNSTSDGNAIPMMLFKVADLENTAHVVQITNLQDQRVGKAGQLNMDHLVLYTQDPVSTPVVSTPASSAQATNTAKTPQEANSGTDPNGSAVSLSTPAFVLSFGISASFLALFL